MFKKTSKVKVKTMTLHKHKLCNVNAVSTYTAVSAYATNILFLVGAQMEAL